MSRMLAAVKITQPAHGIAKRNAVVAPPPAAGLSGWAEELSGSGVAGLCAVGPPGAQPAAPPAPYLPPVCVDTLTAVRCVRPPTALRKTLRTPTRPSVTTAVSRAYSTSPAPASQVRNRRKSCRTGTPVTVYRKGQRSQQDATKAVRGEAESAECMPGGESGAAKGLTTW